MMKISPGSLTGQSSAAQRLIHLQLFALFAAFALFGFISHQKKCRGQFSDAGYSVDVFSVLTFTLFVVRGFYLALGIFWKAVVGFSVTLLLSCSPV